MTYCIGVLLKAGIVLASDSRTNAGVDNFATFCKMTVFERPGDRVIVLLSLWSLAGTQAVIGTLKQRTESPEWATDNIWAARTMFDVAMMVSDAVRHIERRDGEHLAHSSSPFNASFIIGGQIKGESLRLFRTFARETSSRPVLKPHFSRPARRSTASRSSIGSSGRKPA